MANRNVDLIIRAKDNASRAFQQVSTALDGLLATQQTVSAGAGKMDAALTRSQGTAAALARQFGQGFTKNFEQAATAFQRIEQTVLSSRSAFEQQVNTLAQNRQAYKDLQTQIKGAEVAIVGAAIKARQSGNLVDEERLAAAQSAYRGLLREAAKVAPTFARQEAAISEAAAELRKIESVALAAAAALREVERTRTRAQGVAANNPSAVANQAAQRGIKALADAERRVELQVKAREAATAQAAEEYRKANDSARRGIGELARQEALLEAKIRARTNAQANASGKAGFFALGVEEAAIARQSQVNAQAAAAQTRAFAQMEASLRRMQAAGRPTVEQQERLARSFRAAAVAADAQRGSISRGISELLKIGQAADIAAGRFNRAAAETTNMRRALSAFYGDSRQALSLMQRLRGEVLSLTASFVGFYGVFNVGSGFVDAFSSLEAATNRLGAAFGQDELKVKDELALLTAEADRLGISFNTLSETYSKFLISGQQAGLETDQLRVIFTQVAEAGRVLKLSNDQLEGTFTALTQIAGKGTLQMEELRQQLGDRLPGAVGIVAQALGYTSDNLAQFYKDVEDGAISSERALVALGQGLSDTFGGSLEASLDSLSAKLGRFQNLLFQRQLTAANAGFIDGFEEALESLNNFLASNEGIEFFERLGAVMGDLLGIIPLIIENIDTLTLLFQTFVSIKVAQVASQFAGNLAQMGTAAVATRQTMLALNSTVYAFSPAAYAALTSAGRLGVALRGLRAVAASLVVGLRSLFLSLGGPIGIAVAAVTFFAIDGLGKVDEATKDLNAVLDTHTSILAEVRTAYLDAADGAKDWKENLEDVTEVEIAAQLEKLRRQLADYRADAANTLNTQQGSAPEARTLLLARAGNEGERQLVQDLLEADRAFNEGRSSAEDFLEVIQAVRDAAPDLIPPETLDRFRQMAQGGKNLEDAIAESEAALRLFEGTATDADLVLLRLKDTTEDAASETDNAAKKTDAFDAAMRELAKSIPSLKAELDKMDAVAKLADDFEAALTAARAMPDAIMRIAAEMDALERFNLGMDALAVEGLGSDFTGASSGVDAAAALLRNVEGFRPDAYYDVNAYRSGYGSDTTTRADGRVERITPSTRVSVEDSERDLYRRLETEFIPRVVAQIGAGSFNQFNPQQQGVLASLAYNYGSLPDRIVEAVRTGSTQEVAAAIRGLGGDNNGVNRNRRNREAAIFTQGVGNEAAVDRAQTEREEAERAAQQRAEDQQEFRDGQRENLDNLRFEAEIENKRLTDREVAKALREAENEAAAVGLTLSQAERAEIEATVRARFAGKQAEEDKNAQLEQGRQIQEEVNQLEERKALLMEQAEFQQNSGDQVGYTATLAELDEVNLALEEAIAKSIAFWESMGGPEAESAITALKRTQIGLQSAGQTAITSGKQISSSFADGAASAIDRFSQRVADGENAVVAFKEEFLRMAGEFLIQIAQMIIRQAIFNAISGGAGGNGNGGAGGFVANLVNGIFRHGGGIVNGSGRSGRKFDPAIFANAARYHGGGIAGLAPNEVPAVLQKEEEILTRSDPRHILNGGGAGGGGGKRPLKIVNAFDAKGFLEEGLTSGEEVMLNWVRSNSKKVKAALG